MAQVTATQTTRAQRAPMDLDAGRMTLDDARHLGLMALAALAISTVGGLLARLTLPSSLDELVGLRFVLFLFGLGVLVVAFLFGALICWLMIGEWLNHRERRDRWDAASLQAYVAREGVEVEQTVSITDFTASRPMHVLTAALMVHRLVLAGEEFPFSTRSLEGPAFLDGVRVGDVPKATAEELPRVFAKLGLITGRAPRQAGEWAAKSEGDVVHLVTKNWGKLP